MHKAIAVLQLILKDFKPSPHDRTLVDILWLNLFGFVALFIYNTRLPVTRRVEKSLNLTKIWK